VISVTVVLPILTLYINLKAKMLLSQHVSRTAVDFFFCYWAMLYKFTQSFVNCVVAMSQAL